MAAEIGAIKLDIAGDGGGRGLACQGFPDFVRQNEGTLRIAADVARELERGDALGGVGEDADRGEQIDEAQLAAGKDRPDVAENWFEHAAHLKRRRVVIL